MKESMKKAVKRVESARSGESVLSPFSVQFNAAVQVCSLLQDIQDGVSYDD